MAKKPNAPVTSAWSLYALSGVSLTASTGGAAVAGLLALNSSEKGGGIDRDANRAETETSFTELAKRVTRMLPFVDHYKGDLKIAEAIEAACCIAYEQGVRDGRRHDK